jgi:hypothetical protein
MKSDLHRVYGLAFVLVADVLVGWNGLKPLLAQYPATASFITYFEANWLNNPQYPNILISLYVELLRQDPVGRSQNQLGRQQQRPQHCSSPTIYRLIDILQGFNSEAELKIMQTATGLEATRKPRNKTVRTKERVKKTVEGYRSASIVAYCRSLGHLNS